VTDPQAPRPDTPAPAAPPPSSGDPTSAGDREGPHLPPTVRDVEYKGGQLDAARGPGLGCFWLQLAALGVLVVVTPLSVGWGWPEALSAALLLATLVLLLFAGQTVIFLLRLVAADRRAELRRAPLASRTRTVGQLEDDAGSLPRDEAAPGPPGEAASGQPGDAGSNPGS
jgi:hypothetical protein